MSGRRSFSWLVSTSDHPRLGEEKTAVARSVHNDRLIDALMARVFSSLQASAGAEYYRERACGATYNAALRQLVKRVVGVLHG